ncbi:MAG: cyclic nucleotide-binding domain-containing protein [Rhodocyclaceae bacterium]|nr:cyclic nucleotide-binding domain-containing protein [Rhodocyclaceae bacterium]
MSAQFVVHALERLQPMASMSRGRLQELASLSVLQVFSRLREALPLADWMGQAVYLLRGELKLEYSDGASRVVVGDTDETRHPLQATSHILAGARPVTEVEILRLDENLVDLTVTWDQLSRGGSGADWSGMSALLGAESLAHGAFAALPPAHIDVLLQRFERIPVKRGDIILRQGDHGDFYYLIESGRCRVTRLVGGVEVHIAELKAGAAFGEEALVSDAPRNATVCMLTDGRLLRLAKAAFVELLREPLLHAVSWNEAAARTEAGARWLDVRFAPEYLHDGLPGALNIPLNELRESFSAMNRGEEYVVYCQSGRRSSAAAFLMSQRGFKASVVEGGLHRRSDGGVVGDRS